MEQLKEKMKEYHGWTTHRIFSVLEMRFPENGDSEYMRDLKKASIQYFGTGKGFRPAFLFLFNELFSEVKDEAVDLAASIVPLVKTPTLTISSKSNSTRYLSIDTKYPVIL